MSVAWLAAKNKLLALAPTLDGWDTVSVYDGPVVTGDAPTEWFSVGFVPDEDFGGSFEQTYMSGGLVEESGTVRSELVCWTGDTDLPTVQARAFALFDALQAAVHADDSLGGVLTGGGSASLAVDVQPDQSTGGAAQRLTVTLSYLARSV